MERPVRSIYMDIVDRRALDGGLSRVTIAANEKVRQPPELDFSGLSTDNYANNPVVMWAHDAVGRSPSGGLPIGRTLRLNKTAEGRIVADFEFLDDDPFAQRVKNAWDRGFLQAASISWVPLESVPVEGGKWRDTRSDLLEWSIVSVPADPEALRAAHRHMIDAVLDSPTLGLPENSSPRPRQAGLDVKPNVDRGPGVAGRTPSGDGLVLTHDQYGDLSAALTLLRGIAGGVQPNGVTLHREASRRSEEAKSRESDVDYIAEAVGAIRRALRSS